MRADHRVARAVVTVLVAAVLAACGGGSSTSPDLPAAAPPPAFVQADVDFAVALSQHHGQALRMTELAQTRARSGAVKDLAADIAGRYALQTDQIATWITEFAQAGAELPGHGIGGHDEAGPGMLKESAVDRLEKLNGRAFDREFRRLMARHHRGGLDLVAQLLATGTSAEVRALAAQLRSTQSAELTALENAS